MIKLSVNLSLLLLGLCVFGTQLLSAQQAKTITKPTKQVTENTLPTATKTEQYTPPVKGVGVVIKKNPGSGASKISGSTNAQGETTIEITEKGNYSFTVKSQTDLINVNNQVKTQGGPIRGVKIGLGKNPTGVVSRWVAPDKNGDVLFTDLEPGSYKVVVLTDGINCPPGFVMNNGVCEPQPKRATDQPVKAATNPRPELVNNGSMPTPAALTEQFVANTCKSNTRQHNIRVTPLDKDGYVTLEVSEADDYMLFLSRKEDGGKPEAKSLPVKRPVYCKNPPCPTTALQEATVTEKGEILLKNLEPGTYSIQFTIDPNDAAELLKK